MLTTRIASATSGESVPRRTAPTLSTLSQIDIYSAGVITLSIVVRNIKMIRNVGLRTTRDSVRE